MTMCDSNIVYRAYWVVLKFYKGAKKLDQINDICRDIRKLTLECIHSVGKGNVADAPEMYGTADTWKGKTVLCNTGSSLQYGLDACLALMGLTEADVTVVQMDAASALAAFQAGQGGRICVPGWTHRMRKNYFFESSCKAD